MNLKKNAIAAALIVPVAFVGLSACGSSSNPSSSKMKGTFPVCRTTKVLDGVRVDRSVSTPCVVKDSSGYGVITSPSSKSSTKSPSPSQTNKTTGTSSKTSQPSKSLKKSSSSSKSSSKR